MTRYKYQLNHRLSLLPEGQYLEQVIEILENEYGLPEWQFNHDRMIAHDSVETIPIDRLLIYANFFRIEVDALQAAHQKEKHLTS